jgi:enoyl-CoA hydratase
MMVRLADAWEALLDDKDVRVVIVTGAGTDVFTAGADLKLLIPLITGARKPEDEWDERFVGDRRLLDKVLLKYRRFHKPVIAAVNGTALAGGAELVQACDIRFAVPEASFGLPEPKRGIVPGGGSLVRLARQVPYAKAMEILLTGEAFSAQWALECGFINRVVPASELMAEALACAMTISANAPLALHAIKQTVLEVQGMDLEEAFLTEARNAKPVVTSRDAREGPRAFMEKRKPIWEGR